MTKDIYPPTQQVAVMCLKRWLPSAKINKSARGRRKRRRRRKSHLKVQVTLLFCTMEVGFIYQSLHLKQTNETHNAICNVWLVNWDCCTNVLFVYVCMYVLCVWIHVGQLFIIQYSHITQAETYICICIVYCLFSIVLSGLEGWEKGKITFIRKCWYKHVCCFCPYFWIKN